MTCSRAAARQRQARRATRVLARQQPAALRAAVVIEHRLDPLLPLAALIDERVAQPDPGAQIEDVIGRDPRLRQPADHQQLAQMPGVRAIALGALLGAAQRRGLRRLGQMHAGADRRSSSTTNRQPVVASSATSSSWPRNRSRTAAPRLAVRRRHARARDLAGRGVDPLGGDLRSMLIKSHYDRHQGPPQAPRSKRLRGPVPRLS